MPTTRLRFDVALTLFLATLVAPGAMGTITDPTLAVTSAVSVSGASARVVQVEGVFPSQALVQVDYPLQLLIRDTGSGTRYVRYDFAGGAVTGVAPELADGLDAGDVFSLLAQGDPAPEARVVFAAPGRIEVLLPASLATSQAEAQRFVGDQGTPFLSNPVPFAVEGLTP
jgi:hypothetical protein